MILLEPHHYIVKNVLAHLPPAIVGPCFPPGRLGTIIIIKIDSSLVILRLAVEPPEVKVTGPKVIENNIQNDGNANLVGALDEPLEAQGTAVV